MTSLSEPVLYRTEDGRSRIEFRFDEESLWLTQAKMAELAQPAYLNPGRVRVLGSSTTSINSATCPFMRIPRLASLDRAAAISAPQGMIQCVSFPLASRTRAHQDEGKA